MFGKRWKKYLVILVSMALASALFVACDSNGESEDEIGAGGAPPDEALIEEAIGEPGDTDLGVEPDESADVTLDEREALTDEGTGEGDAAAQTSLPALMPVGEFYEVAVVNEDGEEVAKVIEVLFHEDGDIALAVVDSEAIIEVEDQEVGAWAVEWGLLEPRVGTDSPDAPLALVTDDFEAVVTPVFETAPMATEGLFVNTTEMGLEEAPARLMRSRAFVGLDAVDLELFSVDGVSLGTIDDLLVDVGEGRMAYVVADAVSVENVVIPWQALEIVEGVIVYTADERAILDAPTVADERMYDAMAEAELQEALVAYWTEAGVLEE